MSPCYYASCYISYTLLGKSFDQTFNGGSILTLNGSDFNFGRYMVEHTIDVFASPRIGIEKRHHVNFNRVMEQSH